MQRDVAVEPDGVVCRGRLETVRDNNRIHRDNSQSQDTTASTVDVSVPGWGLGLFVRRLFLSTCTISASGGNGTLFQL